MSTHLHLLCGANGAGKSAFYRRFISDLGLPFVNAHEIAKQIKDVAADEVDRTAWARANNLRDSLLAAGKSFVYETVFSHPSKLDLIREAQDAGYLVYLHFIYLESSLLHEARVKTGFSQGGRT